MGTAQRDLGTLHVTARCHLGVLGVTSALLSVTVVLLGVTLALLGVTWAHSM